VGHGVDDRLLERLILEEGESLVDRVLASGERLSSAMMARISASIRTRSSSLKCAPPALEVVVEAVGDRRAMA